MVIVLIIVPLVAALVAFLIPSDRVRPWIVAITGAGHTAAAVAIVAMGIRLTNISPWLELDALGQLGLLLVSVVFLICAT